MMKQDAFRYDFTMKELAYFLLKKKKCPKCGGDLRKSKEYEVAAGSELNSKSDPFFVPNARVKHYFYMFTCQQCGSEYTLKELAK